MPWTDVTCHGCDPGGIFVTKCKIIIKKEQHVNEPFKRPTSALMEAVAVDVYVPSNKWSCVKLNGAAAAAVAVTAASVKRNVKPSEVLCRNASNCIFGKVSKPMDWRNESMNE